jgi:hypothetical protein
VTEKYAPSTLSTATSVFMPSTHKCPAPCLSKTQVSRWTSSTSQVPVPPCCQTELHKISSDAPINDTMLIKKLPSGADLRKWLGHDSFLQCIPDVPNYPRTYASDISQVTKSSEDPKGDQNIPSDVSSQCIPAVSNYHRNNAPEISQLPSASTKVKPLTKSSKDFRKDKNIPFVKSKRGEPEDADKKTPAIWKNLRPTMSYSAKNHLKTEVLMPLPCSVLNTNRFQTLIEYKTLVPFVETFIRVPGLEADDEDADKMIIALVGSGIDNLDALTDLISKVTS